MGESIVLQFIQDNLVLIIVFGVIIVAVIGVIVASIISASIAKKKEKLAELNPEEKSESITKKKWQCLLYWFSQYNNYKFNWKIYIIITSSLVQNILKANI